MRRITSIVIVSLLVPLFIAAQTALAGISVTVTGSWQETIDKNDLISGAGSDLQDTYTTVVDSFSALPKIPQ